MNYQPVDCVVIGAGVVGLAVARTLALEGREVIVLEKTGLIGSEISARNSEVIHAGIYYAPGSLKARLCIAGKQKLYDYLALHNVPHKRCGKLIVAANDAQAEQLEKIRANGLAIGCGDLEMLDQKQVLALEPELTAVAAISSPSTGILDAHGLMLALQGEFEAAGGVIAFESPVKDGEVTGDGIRLDIGGREPSGLLAHTVINAAGLDAVALARGLKNFPKQHLPPSYLAKGNYFTLSGKHPFSHLIYPVPESAGLGVHLTLDMAGAARFGPDVEWVETRDYEVDPARADTFYPAIRSYWPGLEDGALLPGYAGIRPKIQAPGDPPADFLIQGPETHGCSGLVNLFGIESPGLTSCLAIADYVAGIAAGHS